MMRENSSKDDFMLSNKEAELVIRTLYGLELVFVSFFSHISWSCALILF